ncbi:hypothetical protein [Tellurirhabdus bombi]|uniref:hypothetical protein n=1 Tax=Tellurirhabdus bombi TaxID=2907205 RepID=UPI001F47D8BC|nr:hypothetical protein [Tellurirhabdus bombi]
MKNTIIALVTLAVFSTGSAIAQRANNVGKVRPAAPYNTPANARLDNNQEDIRIDRLDAVVDLSRKQEKELKLIEDRYDRRELMALQRRSPQAYQRTLQKKQQEMLDVLTKKQRQKWVAYQDTYKSYDRGGFYGRRG